MTAELTFDNWWDDLSHKFRNDKDGGVDMIDRLKLEVHSLSHDKREAFNDELLEGKTLNSSLVNLSHYSAINDK